jgi:hypothetical protein
LTSTSGKTYKQIYKDIKLLSIKYTDLSNVKTLPYEITDYCVINWLEIYVDKKIRDKLNIILKSNIDLKNGLTYPEIFEIAKYYNFTCIARLPTLDIIDRFDKNKNERTKKNLDFIIHNNHMYVLEKQLKNEPTRKRILIKSLSEIHNYEYSDLNVETIVLYNEIEEYINKNYIKFDYSFTHLKFKTNNIILDPNFTINVEKIKEEGSSGKSIYNLIDNSLNLRGYMNEETIKTFQGKDKIRVFDKRPKQYRDYIDIQYDQNKSYAEKLKRNITFPVPTINDYWQDYKKKPIVDYGIYYCELNSYDKHLGLRDDKYSGYAVKILIKEKRIKKITKQLICENKIILNQERVKKFDNDMLRQYIGWLQSYIRVKQSDYNNIPNEEALALINYYDIEEASYNVEEKILTISKGLLVKKTGCLSNFIIKELTNIDLYNFNKEFIKLNPTATNIYTKTDSLGYKLIDKKYKNPKMYNQKEEGKFKIEKDNTKYINDNEYDYLSEEQNEKIPEPKSRNNIKVKYHNKEDIIKLLEKKESLQLFGSAGQGKSWITKNVVIPYLKENNLNYILTSTTIDNTNLLKSEGYNARTVQGIFTDKSTHEIIKIFRDIQYLIIDESSQLEQGTYKLLEYVKNNTDCKFILIGDNYQCKSVDAKTESWIITDFVYDLTNNNVIELKYNENGRHTKELFDILEYIKSNKNDVRKSIRYVIEKFKNVDETTTKLNLAYYHKTCADVQDKDPKKECFTVHSKQGTTIKEDFTVFDIWNMSIDILYTAISRAKSKEQVSIYINYNNFDKN